MKKRQRSLDKHGRFQAGGLIALLGMAFTFGLTSAHADWQPATNLTFKAAVGTKVAYDSNVYLQDTDPAPGVPGAVPANHGSWIFSVMPQIGVDYQACEAFKVTTGYSGEYTWFNSAASEDHMIHRFPLNASGKVGETDWKIGNAFTYIDGSNQGPVFGAPGQVPAIGGIPMRDRRDALIYKGSLGVQQPLGKGWFIRPEATAYVHDFYAEQRPSPAGGTYENYVDRQEITGGAHVGRDTGRNTALSLGYVYGRQDQFSLRGVDSPYDNSLHRVLVGLKGSPWKWVRLDLLAGPDFRDFDNRIAGFDDQEVVAYVLSTVTFLPSPKDSVVLFNKRYEQPAFGGPSMYEDVTYKAAWVRRWRPELTSSLSFQAYLGDWKLPAKRVDWIYTPAASLTYVWNKKVTVELAYSYDWTDCEYSDGRNFSRHIGSLMLGYRF